MIGRLLLSCALLLAGIQARSANPACDKDSPSFDPEKCGIDTEKSPRKCDPSRDKDCPALDQKKTPLRGQTTPLTTGAPPSGSGAPQSAPADGGTTGEEPSPDEEPAGMSAKSAERGRDTSARAMSKASAAGSAMMKSMAAADDGMAGPKNGGAASKPAGAAPGGEARAAGASDRPANIANPATAQELALASVAGYGETFEQLGLKVGAGPGGASSILRRDGTPASAEEVARLAERIGEEPAALMQRPDFFKVLPREGFTGLKQEYRKPERRQDEFKHIELSTAQRDFQRSESCSKLSGNCNRFARQTSYRRGDYVPPEDLNDIWKKIKSEASGADDPYGSSGAAAAAPAPAGDVSNLGVARARSVTRRIASMFGGLFGGGEGGDSAPEGKPWSGAERAAQERVEGAGLPWGSASRREPVAFSEAPKRAVAGVIPPASPGGAVSSARARGRGRARGAKIAAAAAGVLLLLLFFWSRGRGEKRVVGAG